MSSATNLALTYLFRHSLPKQKHYSFYFAPTCNTNFDFHAKVALLGG